MESNRLIARYRQEIIEPMVQWAGLSEGLSEQNGQISVDLNRWISVGPSEVRWGPLTVRYRDHRGTAEDVYRLDASLDFKTSIPQLQRAEIVGILELIRQDQSVEWRNPLTNQLYHRIKTGNVNQTILNSWYLFVGGIIPMLRDQSYWFVRASERQTLQVVMLRKLRQLYEGVV